MTPRDGLERPRGDETAWVRRPRSGGVAGSVWSAFSDVADVDEAAPAVVAASGAVAMDYGTLRRRSRRFAAGLAARGIQPGDRVALVLERSADAIALRLAVAAIGAVSVPIDPQEPAAARHRRLSRFDVQLTVGDDRRLGMFPLAALLGEAEAAASSVAASFPTIDPATAACILSTSGSTGEPRGVAIPHRAIIRLGVGNGFLEGGSGLRFLHAAPPSFDASLLEIHLPLLTGGAVVPAPPGAFDLRSLAETIRTGGVTHAWLTAALFHACVDALPELFDPLEAILTGGDVVSPRHVDALRRRRPQLRILNGYGPTENTTFTTVHEIPAGPDRIDPAVPLPIGRPVAGTGVCIIDEAGMPAKTGALGELVATGDGLAIGYLTDEDATAAAFVTLPGLGERGYRTGDLARIDEDGTAHFIGRRDGQVKIRGFRVEPSEVEAILRRIPGVARAAVVVLEREGSGDRSLHGFLVAGGETAGEAADAEAVSAALRAEHPAHLVPSSLTWLRALPFTPTGKVDRRQLAARLQFGIPVPLPAPVGEALADSAATVAGAVAAGLLIARCWHPSKETVHVDVTRPGGPDRTAWTARAAWCASATVETVLAAVSAQAEDAPPAGGAADAEPAVRRRGDGPAADEAIGEGICLVLSDPDDRPVEVHVGPDGVRLVIAPGSPEAAHERWAAHVAAGFEAAIDPGATRTARVADLDLRSEAERDCVDAWSIGPPGAGPSGATLVDLVERGLVRAPDRPAVRSATDTLTAKRFLELRDATVATLLEAGLGPGDRVGLLDDRTASVIVGLHALFRLGAVAVPLDPASPAQRTAAMIETAAVAAILVGHEAERSGASEAFGVEHLPRVPIARWHRGRIHGPAAGDWTPGAALPPPPKAGDDAVVLFTSGTTGRPRGVPVRHESLVNRLAWKTRQFGLDPTDVVVQKNRLVWDVALWEAIWPLTAGATCLVLDGGVAADPRRLAETVRAESATVMHLVPSIIGPFASAVRAVGPNALRLVIASGEVLEPGPAASLLDAIPGELWNLYGPTEAAIDVTAWRCGPGSKRIPIGRPIDGVAVRVLDDAGLACPVGVVGELHLEGVQVSDGYLAGPPVSGEGESASAAAAGAAAAGAAAAEPTAAAASPGPFGWRPGTAIRRYRTGDLGAWNEDGTLRFVGRRDGQLKIHGLRIEPSEVEAAFSGLDGVREVAVCRIGRGLEAFLAAGCVFDSADVPDDETIARIREHLKARLDGPVVPTRIVAVDAIPRLPSGKVDRRRLPDLLAERLTIDAETPSDLVAGGRASGGPGDAGVHQTIAEVWCEILGRPPAAPGEDFILAGGDSLSLLRLLLEVERRLGIDLPAAPALAEPTVERIAAVIRALADERGVAGFGPRSPEERPAADSAEATRPSIPAGAASGLMRLTTGPVPMVMVPHIGGSLGFLTAAAARLEGAVALHGLRPQGTFVEEPAANEIDQMVEHFTRIVLATGWTHLLVGGFSSGAIVAAELGHRLTEAGVRVGPLLLVDGAPTYRSATRTPMERIRRRVARAVPVRFRGLGPFGATPAVAGEPDVSTAQRILIQATMAALVVQRPKPRRGRAIVVHRRGATSDFKPASWRRVLSGPFEHIVTGASHMGLWDEPHVRPIVDRVRAAALEFRSDAGSDAGSDAPRPRGRSATGRSVAPSVSPPLGPAQSVIRRSNARTGDAS